MKNSMYSSIGGWLLSAFVSLGVSCQPQSGGPAVSDFLFGSCLVTPDEQGLSIRCNNNNPLRIELDGPARQYLVGLEDKLLKLALQAAADAQLPSSADAEGLALSGHKRGRAPAKKPGKSKESKNSKEHHGAPAEHPDQDDVSKGHVDKEEHAGNSHDTKHDKHKNSGTDSGHSGKSQQHDDDDQDHDNKSCNSHAHDQDDGDDDDDDDQARCEISPGPGQKVVKFGKKGLSRFELGDAGVFVWQGNTGRFTESVDAIRFTGFIERADSSQRKFRVEALLTEPLVDVPEGHPVLELPSQEYVQNGGNVDPQQWKYFSNLEITLTGLGVYNGAKIKLTPDDQLKSQFGLGANGLNDHPGASGWFHAEILQQPRNSLALTGSSKIETLQFSEGLFRLDLGVCHSSSCLAVCSGNADTTPGSGGGTASVPGAFEILSPKGEISSQQPEVTWTASENANMYDLALMTAPGCDSEPIQEFANLEALSQELSTLQVGTYYYLCVTSKGDIGARAAENNGLSFVVVESPTQPMTPGDFQILEPSGVIQEEQPTVTWTISDRADSYDLEIRKNDCSGVVVATYIGVTERQQVIGPLENGIYAICLQAVNGAGAVAAANSGQTFEVRIPTLPDQPFHRIFTSSALLQVETSYEFPPEFGKIGHLDAADWTCNFIAHSAGLLPDWDGKRIQYYALLSVLGLSASFRFPIVGPLINMKNLPIAEDAFDLFDGQIMNKPGYTEAGDDIAELGTPRVITGSTEYGDWTGMDCGGLNQPSATGTVGDANQTNAGWLNSPPDVSCDQKMRLYCVSPAIMP